MGSVKDQNCYKGFHFKEKVEKTLVYIYLLQSYLDKTANSQGITLADTGIPISKSIHKHSQQFACDNVTITTTLSVKSNNNCS